MTHMKPDHVKPVSVAAGGHWRLTPRAWYDDPGDPPLYSSAGTAWRPGTVVRRTQATFGRGAVRAFSTTMCIVVLGAVLTGITHAQDNVCNALLRHGLYDELDISGKSIEQHRVYDYVCRESNKHFGVDKDNMFEIGYKGFALEARLGTTTMKEYYDLYCSKSEEEFLGITINSVHIRRINEGVLRAWNSCVDSVDQGVKITTDISHDETSVRFELKRTEGEGHVLRGVDSDIFQCESGGDTINEQGLNGSNIDLEGTAFNFICTRKEEQTDSFLTKYYPSGYLVLNLSTGQFVLDFRERVIGKLRERLADLEFKLERLQRQLSAGLIVAFDRQSCPDGWEPYNKGVGRFLIGAHEGAPHGTVGGTSSHSHSGRTGVGGDARGVDNDNDHWPSANEHRHDFTTSTEDHIPPYVSVLFLYNALDSRSR